MLKPSHSVSASLLVCCLASSSVSSSEKEGNTEASALVRPAADGLALNSPEFNRLYGPGVFNMNMLGNTVVGIPSLWESVPVLRFMAMNTGRVESIRFILISGIGYSKGNGGTIRIRLLPDDGTPRHLPDLGHSPLAEAVFKPNLPDNREKKSYYPLIQFRTGPRSVKAGKLYHLVFENIDAKPNENFSSIDNSLTPEANGRPSRWLNTRDWASLIATRSIKQTPRPEYKWTNLTETGSSGNLFSPILQINMENGQSQGVSDMESGSVDPQRVYTATREHPIRERFSPSSDKRITGLSIATAASVPGTLNWRILHKGKELSQGTITQPSANYSPITSNTGIKIANMRWYDVALQAPVNFSAGQHYDIEFKPAGNSEWKFGDHSHGAQFGFTWPAAFTESQAQHFRNGKWLDTFHWNYSRSEKGANWPVVLHLAP